MDILGVLQEKLGEEVFTEDFKKELEAQLEIVINEKVQVQLAESEVELKAKYDAKEVELAESIKAEADEYKLELVESVDGYLDYAVKEFFQENKIAIEDEFTVKAAKELIEKFAGIIEDNHFTVDVDQKKRMVAMESKIDEVQEKLNAVIKENIDYKLEIKEYQKSLKFKQLTEGLSKLKIEKILSLSEGLDFKDMQDFERKIKICIERVADKKQKVVQEEVEQIEEKVQKETKTKSDVDKYLD